MNQTPTTIRVFTSTDVPGSDETVAQLLSLATAHGVGMDLIDTAADPLIAINAGVVAVPAVIVLDHDVEISRRECAFSGRRLARWFDRQVAAQAAPCLVPAIA